MPSLFSDGEEEGVKELYQQKSSQLNLQPPYSQQASTTSSPSPSSSSSSPKTSPSTGRLSSFVLPTRLQPNPKEVHELADTEDSSSSSYSSEEEKGNRRSRKENEADETKKTRMERWRDLVVRIRASNNAVLFAVSLALLTDMLVYGVVFPILPEFAINELNATTSEVGILFASYAVGLLGATPIFGVVSDRVGRKSPMLLSLVGLTIATVVFGISREYYQLILARIAQGVSAAGSWVVGLALVADVYPVSQHGSAMGVVSGVNSFGLLIGPPVGGFLYERFGYLVPFIICSIISVIDLGLQAIIIPNDDQVAERKKEAASYEDIKDDSSTPSSPSMSTTSIVPSSKTTETGEELNETSSITITMKKENTSPTDPPLTIWNLVLYREVATVLWLTIVDSAIFSGIEPVLPIFLNERFDASPTLVGLLYFAVAVSYLLGCFLAGKLCDRFRAQPLMVLGAVVLTAVCPLIALPRTLFLEVLVLAAFGISVALISTPSMVALGQFVDSHGGGAYAQIYALYLSAYSCGMMLGPLGAGFIMEKTNFTWACIFFSLCMLTYFPLLLLPKIVDFVSSWKERRRLGREMVDIRPSSSSKQDEARSTTP